MPSASGSASVAASSLRAEIKEIKITGDKIVGEDLDDTNKKIRKVWHKTVFNKCLDQLPASAGPVSGKLNVTVSQGAGNKVNGVDFKTTPTDQAPDAFKTCIKDKLMKMELPAGTPKTKISFDVEFVPKEAH